MRYSIKAEDSKLSLLRLNEGFAHKNNFFVEYFQLIDGEQTLNHF